jgi:Recombinase zinc beta ribbon domain
VGRPANGVESKYLLTGFARCGACGGTMEVRNLDWRYTRRGHFYQCASYVRRGPAICSNKLPLPLAKADQAILDAIEATVLRPTVVRAAIRETMAEAQRPQALEAGREAALRKELRDLEGQLANLTIAVKLGGALPALVAEMQAIEQRKAEIQRPLTPAPALRADVATLETLMGQWRAMFRANVPIARQILRELLAGERIVLTPQADGAGYDFVAPCTLDRIAAGHGSHMLAAYSIRPSKPGEDTVRVSSKSGGLDTPQRLVTPAGFEPAISTLKGLRPRPG